MEFKFHEDFQIFFSSKARRVFGSKIALVCLSVQDVEVKVCIGLTSNFT